MRFHETISYKGVPTGRGNVLWYVTYDGRILGDDRPFDTAEEASAAAIAACGRGEVINGVARRIYRPGVVQKTEA